MIICYDNNGVIRMFVCITQAAYDHKTTSTHTERSLQYERKGGSRERNSFCANIGTGGPKGGFWGFFQSWGSSPTWSRAGIEKTWAFITLRPGASLFLQLSMSAPCWGEWGGGDPPIILPTPPSVHCLESNGGRKADASATLHPHD